MKPIIKVLLFMLAVVLVIQCEKDELKPAPYFNYPYFEIIDTAFLYALINEGVDTNGDSLISYSEAEAVDTLNCGKWQVVGDGMGGAHKVSIYEIESLEGIEAFKNLVWLECKWNFLTNLDVSKNLALKVLECSQNELESLDVSGCTKLSSLRCRSNKLISIDISNSFYSI